MKFITGDTVKLNIDNHIVWELGIEDVVEILDGKILTVEHIDYNTGSVYVAPEGEDFVVNIPDVYLEIVDTNYLTGGARK